MSIPIKKQQRIIIKKALTNGRQAGMMRMSAARRMIGQTGAPLQRRKLRRRKEKKTMKKGLCLLAAVLMLTAVMSFGSAESADLLTQIKERGYITIATEGD